MEGIGGQPAILTIVSSLTTLSLSGMQAALANREISAAELVDAHLERIAAVQPKINAFVSVFTEQAAAEARAPRPGHSPAFR